MTGKKLGATVPFEQRLHYGLSMLLLHQNSINELSFCAYEDLSLTELLPPSLSSGFQLFSLLFLCICKRIALYICLTVFGVCLKNLTISVDFFTLTTEFVFSGHPIVV